MARPEFRPLLRPDELGNQVPRSYKCSLKKKPQDLPIGLQRDIAQQIGAAVLISPNTVHEIEQLQELEEKTAALPAPFRRCHTPLHHQPMKMCQPTTQCGIAGGQVVGGDPFLTPTSRREPVASKWSCSL